MTISSCTNKNWKVKTSSIVSNQHNTGKLLQPIEEIPEAITNTNSFLYSPLTMNSPASLTKIPVTLDASSEMDIFGKM